MSTSQSQLCTKLRTTLKNNQDLAILLARIVIGWVFLWAGWGKIERYDQVVGFFGSIGIPMASIQVPVVIFFEMAGGVALILGFMTRFFALSSITIMIVATLTAHWGEFHEVKELFQLSTFLNLVILVQILFHGAGKYSLDQLCCKKGRC